VVPTYTSATKIKWLSTVEDTYDLLRSSLHSNSETREPGTEPDIFQAAGGIEQRIAAMHLAPDPQTLVPFPKATISPVRPDLCHG
jgi:hypothetical protein